MDIRIKKSQSSIDPHRTSTQEEQSGVQLSQQQINDSIIFNIMKKIQCRQRLISQYKQQKEQQNKTFLTKYLMHSNLPLYYAVGVVMAKIYKFVQIKSPTLQQIVSLPNFLFHICVIISINEYCKYKNIFVHKAETAMQYKLYQRNVQNLMEQKMKKFSILNKITNAQFMNQARLMQAFKYRLVV